MQTARLGILIGYTLLAVGYAAIYGFLRLFGHLGPLFFTFVAAIISMLFGATAFAVFGGSFVCAVRSLCTERVSRSIAGYVTVLLTAVSAVGLGALYVRLFVVGR